MSSTDSDRPAPQDAAGPRAEDGGGDDRRTGDEHGDDRRSGDARAEDGTAKDAPAGSGPAPQDPAAGAPSAPAAPRPPGGPSDPGPALPGMLAALGAVVIWAGWIVATRDQSSGGGAASPLDVALMRYGVPALLLCPIWLRRGFIPKGENLGALAVMTLGWGGPFLALCSKGLQSAPVAMFAPLVMAGMPLLVALWDRIAGGAQMPWTRKAGLALILASLALSVAPALAGGAGLAGLPWILAAATGWAAYTVAIRGSTLSGLEAAACVCAWSTPPLLVATLVFGTGLPRMAAADIAYMAFSQGIASGIAAVALYTFAIRRLGAGRASSFASLAPIGAALGGGLLLGEALGAREIGAALAAGIGVALTNRAASVRIR